MQSSGAAFRPKQLLRQPGGFEGFGVAEEILGPEDLPVSEGDDLPEFLAELDTRRAAACVEMAEEQNRLAEVANLLNLRHETSPRLAAIFAPGLSHAVVTPICACSALQGLLKGGMPLDLGISLGQEGAQIVGVPGLMGSLERSTFSSDIAYS